MTRSLTLALAAGLVAASALVAAPAHAESAPAPPRCTVGVLPRDGKGPMNLPAFVVENLSSPGLVGGTTAPIATPILDIDVIPDPRAPGVTLWVPKATTPPAAGAAYSIEYTETCSDPSRASAQPFRTWTFEAASATPLPTSIGTTRQLADGRAVIVPSADLAAFLPVTHFEVSVDGVPAGMTRYGIARGAELDVEVSAYGASVGGASTEAAVAACRGGAKTEKHELTILAHVAGAATDPPPVTVTVTIGCATASPAPTLPDGGGDDRGASGGDDLASGDGGGGGCSTSGTGSASGLAAFFAIGGVLGAMLRKSRNRRRV